MTKRHHTNDHVLPFGSAVCDEGSSIRPRTPVSRPVSRTSEPELSLDQRLESKLAEAHAQLAKLEPQDARARLLHIAMLRRDLALLDGILADLASPRTLRHSR